MLGVGGFLGGDGGEGGGGGGEGGGGGLWLHGLLQPVHPHLLSVFGDPGTVTSSSFLGFNPLIGVNIVTMRRKIIGWEDIFSAGHRNLELLEIDWYVWRENEWRRVVHGRVEKYKWIWFKRVGILAGKIGSVCDMMCYVCIVLT